VSRRGNLLLAQALRFDFHHSLPYQIGSVDVARSGDGKPIGPGRLALKSSGSLREASEMISRPRTTEYSVF
jgi:hypothetical protein